MSELKTKIKKEVLWGIDFVLYSIIAFLKNTANKIDLVLIGLDYQWYFQKLKEFENRQEAKERGSSLEPVSFEAELNSEDFFTRHNVANKIISWYIYEQGTPSEELLNKAASVLLEDFEYTEEHLKKLVSIYKMQRENPDSVEADNAEKTFFNELPVKEVLK